MPAKTEIIREQVLQRGHSDLYEKEYRRKDGTIIPVELRTILSRDEEGRPSAMWAIVRDIGERKRVEAELQGLAQQRQLALDAARLGWWHYNPLTEIVTYDRRYRHIFDVTGTERPNAELLERLHPDDLPGVRAMVEAALDPNDPKPYCAEYRIRRRDGSLRWVEAHGIATFSGEDDRRHAIALVGTVQDITERKRVEQALQSARSRAETKTRHLEAVLQALPVGVVVTDARGGILLANGRDEEIWGPRPATHGVEDYAQYRAWWAHSGKPVAPQEWASAQAVEKGETVIGQVLEIRRFDGQRRCIHNSAVPIRDGEGRVVGSAVAIQDITELRRAEAAARASEEKFKTLVEHSPDIISRLDRDRRHIFVNSAMTRATGLSPEHCLGKTNSELGMPAELCRQWDECLDEVFTIGRAVTLELAFPGPEGLRYYSSLIVPEWAPDGTVQSVLGIARDITERKQAEEELREAGRRKDELLAMLAHELRNPLAPIRTGVELLGLARGDPATTAEVVPMMQRQLGHLVRLVDDLLEVSRINRGRIELRPERVDLAEILGHAIENSMPFVEAGCHELEVDVAPDQLVLEADRVRLVQVFANLLDNAAKYTPPGGQIRVTGRRIDGEAVVSIRDTGQGIPTEMLPLVFDLFAQADRSTSRATSGLGIGLFLVRNLVELHGGRVEARSEGPGRGSELIVSLPLTDRVAFDTARPASPESAGMSRRVLVVDDNRDAADSLGLLLETLGAEVRVAYDGPSALAALTAFGPAAVLLDIGMPGMDGYEAAGHIRASEGEEIKLIAVTGWGQDEDRRRSAEAGFDHHLTKPLDLARLQAIFASLAG
jgi:PAS domain S-box-containing protein